MSSRFKTDSRGFTLIEMVLVLSLMAIMLAIVPFYFSGALPSSRIKAEARGVVSAVRYARAQAVISGRRQALTFDLESGNYGLSGGKSKDLEQGMSFRVETSYGEELSKGKYTVIFGTGGRFRDGDTIVLSDGRREERVVLDPVAGSAIVRGR